MKVVDWWKEQHHLGWRGQRATALIVVELKWFYPLFQESQYSKKLHLCLIDDMRSSNSGTALVLFSTHTTA